MPEEKDGFVPDDGFVADGDGFVPDAPAAKSAKSVEGFAGNVVRSGTKFLSDAASGIANLKNVSVGDSARFAALGALAPASYVFEDAYRNGITSPWRKAYAAAQGIGQYLGDRYGGAEKAAETLYQDPVGALSDASTVLGGGNLLLRGASKAAQVANAPKAATWMNRAATVANAASEATNPLTAIGRVPGIQKPINAIAERVYGMNLKPSTTLDPRDREAIVRMGLTEKIPTSRGGLTTTRDKIDAINDEVAGKIASGANQGLRVDPSAVVAETARSRNAFRNQVNPRADLATIDASAKEFLETAAGATPNNPMGNPIPIDKAQSLKSGTYRKLRDSYGEQGMAAKEVQKDLARGLKNEIYSHFPELKDLGQKEKVLIQLEEQLERFVGREGNKLPVSLNTPLTVGAGGNWLGALQHVVDRMPGVTSRIAAAMYKATGTPVKPARVRQIINAASAPERGKQQ